MSYERRLVKGLSIVFVMSFLASVVAYVTRVYLARVMQPEEYGLLYAVYTFITFFLFFRDFGSHQALVYYIARYRIEEKFDEIKTAIFSTFKIQLISSLILILFGLFFAKFLSLHYFKNPDATLILYVFLAYIFTSSFFRVIKATFLGFQDMMWFSSCELFKNALTLIFTLILFHFSSNKPLMGAIAYPFVTLLMVFSLLPIFFRKYFHWGKFKVINLKEMHKKIMVYGVPVTLTGMGGDLIAYADVLMLTYFANLHDVGIYSAMLSTAVSILFISRAVSSVFLPMMSEMWLKNMKKEMVSMFFNLERYVLIFFLPALILVAIFGKDLINLLFGANYVEGTLAFQIVIIATLFYVIASISNTITSATGQPKEVTKIIFFGAIINVLGNLIAIPHYGYYGAAVMTALSYVIIYLLSVRHILNRLEGSVPWKQHGLLLIAVSIFSVLVFYLHVLLPFSFPVNFIITFFVSAIIYGFFCVIFKLFNFKEFWKNVRLVFKKHDKKLSTEGENE